VVRIHSSRSIARYVHLAADDLTLDAECRAFEGRVIEVISGDTIVVAERNPEGGFTETRVGFSSIRFVPHLVPSLL
jgi:hypothetical protein